MKKFILLLCFIFFVASPTFAGDEFFKNGQFYHNKKHNFSVTLPEGWTIEPGRQPNVVMKAHDEGDVLFFAVTVKDLPPGKGDSVHDMISADDIVEKHRSKGINSVLFGSWKTLLCDQEALMALYSMSIGDIFTLHHQTLTIKEDRLYSLQFTTGSCNNLQVDLMTFELGLDLFYKKIALSFKCE